MGRQRSAKSKHPSEALCSWFLTPLGQEMAACEKRMADSLIHNAFGYHLLQIGYDASVKLYDSSPVSHKVMLCPQMTLGMHNQTIIADHHELPIIDSSQDIVILHHALDFAEEPHQILREASRVLRQGGHLLIVSFNVNSLWSIARCFHRAPSPPWSAKGFSHGRLHDWIKLLDLSELKSTSDFFRPPIDSERWFRRFAFLETLFSKLPTYNGCVLMMWVRKDVTGLTPLKPRWNTRKLISFPVAEPTARHKSARGKSS